ncbi:MAG: hypothetical protein MUC36_08070 [Planctomycetes bacterium]|jgi:hypothetical protein|nr:hypothetical protein [Planctomycetota bacterium]
MLHRIGLVVLPLLVAAVMPAQDQLTKQALQRIEKCEQQEPKLAAGDSRGIQGCLADLDWAQKRLNAVYDKNEPTWKQAVDRVAAVRTKLTAKAAAAPGAAGGGGAAGVDAAALAQLDKEIGNAQHNFELAPPAMYQDESRASAVRRQLEQLTTRLQQLPAADAGVAKVAARLLSFQQRFDAVMQKVAGDRAGATDLAARLEALSTKYTEANAPKLPELPLSAERVRAFLLQMRGIREHELPADQQLLAVAKQNGALDKQRVDLLDHWIGRQWPRRLDELSVQLAANVDGAVAEAMRTAEFVAATDPNDRDQVVNRVLARGAFDIQVERLRAGLEAVAVARIHDELAPRSGGAAVDRQAQQQQLEQALAHLQKLAVTTLDAVRLPAARSTDPKLVAIAEETLKQKDYGVGTVQRMVINTDLVRRERKEGWIRPGTVTTTVSIYHYVWDEFQVATAEPKGDEIWIWFNTLKHYYSGDPTTPVGRWILSTRFESTRILPENVGK